MTDNTLSKKQLSWLSAGMFLSIAALWLQLPWQILICSSFFIAWRGLLIQKKLTKPGKMLNFCLLIVSGLILATSISPVISLQGCVGFLVLMASLKILESESTRDYLLLVFLGCLISACLLLFSRSILSFSYCLLTMLILHVALLQSFTAPAKGSRKRALKTTSIIFLQALPIALTLFVVLPRIGSLWTVPLNSNVAKTGISESLTAGDMGRLSQDFSVAMRVTFSGENRPEKSAMYWRAMSLANFDGRTWSRDKQPIKLSQSALASLRKNQQTVTSAAALNTQQYRDQVMLEASGRSWLYGLNTAMSNGAKLYQWQDYSISKPEKVLQRYQYQLWSDLNYIDNTPLSEQQWRVFTALVGEDNSKSRAFARQLKGQYGSAEKIVSALALRFNTDFIYTLAPGKSPPVNPIDDFLFTNKRGYCEHFASASAFVLRAAGIPARIATGYQGGQWSADNKYLIVTQAQAHAWVEYWSSNKGWQRFDPTASVAPQRIEQGSVEVLDRFNESLGFTGVLRANSWLRHLQLNWDGLNYQWHRWVLGYNTQIQLEVLKQLLGGFDSWRIGLLMLGVMFMVAVPAAVIGFWSSNNASADPLLTLITKLEKKLFKLHFVRDKSETIKVFLRRTAQLSANNKQSLMAISQRLEKHLYGQTRHFSVADKKHLEQLIRGLK